MKTQLPIVEKGIPIPCIKKDERNHPKSPWPEFLQALEPGDSFVLPWNRSTNTLAIAKWMKIPLVKQELPRTPGVMAQVRIWRTD